MPVGGGGKGGKGGGGSTSTVNVNNAGTVELDADSTVEIKGLDNVKVTARLEPTPFKTDARQELVLPQPFKTENKTEVVTDNDNNLIVDLKPIALDLCMTANLGKLPQAEIRQPWHQHIGFTWFNIEVFGFNFSGETKTVLEDLPKRPLIEWPAQRNAERAAGGGGETSERGAAYSQSSGTGLRVRVK